MLALLSYVTELTEMHVKMFFGIEYECPRGHRFFCSSPDKVIKVTGAQMVKVSDRYLCRPPCRLGVEHSFTDVRVYFYLYSLC